MTILHASAELMAAVRARNPLVHHLTNYVTVNDCANITLAIGGAPIMADAAEEVKDIAAVASALVLNIGTLNTRMVDSMLAAGKSANANGVPVVLDPVGAGASALRTATVERLLDQVRIAVVRGNVSEIRAVGGLASHVRGVDAGSMDADEDAGRLAASVARRLGATVAVTGPVDAISDGKRIVHVKNGHPELSKVSGTGCMCTSLVGAFLGAAPDKALEGAAAALVCMGIAGDIAFEKAGGLGIGSFRVAVVDAIGAMDGETIMKRGRVDEARD